MPSIVSMPSSQLGRESVTIAIAYDGPLRGVTIPTLFTRDDVRVLQATGWMSISQPQVARILASRRWTLDARRGQLVVDR